MKKQMHLSFGRVLLLCVLLACGLFASLPAKAQNDAWEISLAKPYVESLTDIKTNSFTATWSNVERQKIENGEIYNPIYFRYIVTREHEAKQDGPYSIAKASIKANPNGRKALGQGGMGAAYLNEQLTQPDWIGSSVAWTGSAIELDGTRYNGYPADALEGLVYIMSPVLNLSNGDGTYTYKFKMKVTGGTGNATFKVFGYNEELTYNKGPENVKNITVSNDGAEHEFTYDGKNGTWAHRIQIVMTSFSKVEFTDGFEVTQTLKKGEQTYRSTSYGYFEYNKAKVEEPTEASPYKDYFVKYSMNLTDIDPRALDVAAAKAAGDRIGFRVLYGMKRPGYQEMRFLKSMYSDPAYFDNQEVVSDYVYLGYVGYEAPNHNNVHPAGPSWDGYHGGAIKVTKELLKNNIGDEIVGIRFATLAGKQPNQVNSAFPAYNPPLPMVFLADKLRMNTDEEEARGKLLMHKQADKFVDGWNSIFFDKPYVITKDSEFFAGLYAYDRAIQGGIAVASIKTKVSDKNSYYVGTNWSGSPAFEEAKFQNNFDGWPLLIHLIVKPKNTSSETANRGEIRSISSPEMLFSDEPLNATLKLYNAGTRSIKDIEVELDVNGTKENKKVELARYISPSYEGDVLINDIAYEKVHGEKTISVKLLKVNGVAQESQTSSATTKVFIYDRDETFDRMALVETFTSENCQYCPTPIDDFEKLLLKPENASITSRLALVSHHSMITPDYLCMKYSKDLKPFLGIFKKTGGEVTFAGAFSPALMINRMSNPHLGNPGGTNGIIYSHIGAKQDMFTQALSFATKGSPAYVGLYLFPYFDTSAQKLKVSLKGIVSSKYDTSRPLYVTILITQDEVDLRNQRGTIPEGFKHRNVLRIVDDAGFKGSQVTIDANRKFLFEKEMSIATVDAKAATLPDNTLLLKPNQTLEDALKHVNVIAVVHNYKELPTESTIEANSDQMLHNEVQNTARRRVSFTKEDSIEETLSDSFDIFVSDRSINVVGEIAHFDVYNLNGLLVGATDLIPGGYIVKITLTNGSSRVVKVVVP